MPADYPTRNRPYDRFMTLISLYIRQIELGPRPPEPRRILTKLARPLLAGIACVAVTLLIGLLISVFTAVFVSHTVFELEYGGRQHIDALSI